MINLFTLKNSILTWLAGAGALVFAIFTIRKGGKDAQLHKQTKTTLDNVAKAKQVELEADSMSDADIRDSLRKEWRKSE